MAIATRIDALRSGAVDAARDHRSYLTMQQTFAETTLSAGAAFVPDRLRGKGRLYIAINAALALLVAFGVATNDHADPYAGLYVVSLFAICSSPLLFIRTYRGKASLLVLFLAYYFAAFGLRDLSGLLAYQGLPPRPTDLGFTGGELGALAGAAAFIGGYALAAGLVPSRARGVMTRDWAPRAIVVIGFLSWIVGFLANVIVQFGVGDLAGGTVGVGLFRSFGGFIALFRILDPLGTLMLIYLFIMSRSKPILVVLIGMMLANLVLGFLGDTKEIAFRSPLLFVFSLFLLKEKVPILAGIAIVLVAALAFDLFASYRTYLQTHGVSRTEAAATFSEGAPDLLGSDKSLGRRFADGLDYFSSRVTLKQNLDVIVARTGDDVPYQNGYTIRPILFAFIPRYILPDKQDASITGQIFAREFFDDRSGVYLSVTQIGELFWNWGWSGLTLGMLSMGVVMALVASLARLDSRPTLPRFLLLMLTIYLLILRFEGGLAMTYTYWARAVVLLMLIHLAAPKVRTLLRPAGEGSRGGVRPLRTSL